MSEMVGAERHLIAYCVSYLFDILSQSFQPFVGNLDLGERMKGISVSHIFTEIVLASCSSPEFVVYKSVGFFCNNMYSQIHLQPCKALLLDSSFHRRGESDRVVCPRGIGIQPDLVAVSSSEELPRRNAVCLSAQIPEGHFDSTNSASLPSMVTVLPYYLEYHLNVTRIQSQYPAFQHQGVSFVGSVPNLTKAIDTLVGVYPYDCRSSDIAYHGNSHIGYLQVARTGSPVYPRSCLRNRVFKGKIQKSAKGDSAECRFFKEVPAASVGCLVIDLVSYCFSFRHFPLPVLFPDFSNNILHFKCSVY